MYITDAVGYPFVHNSELLEAANQSTGPGIPHAEDPTTWYHTRAMYLVVLVGSLYQRHAYMHWSQGAMQVATAPYYFDSGLEVQWCHLGSMPTTNELKPNSTCRVSRNRRYSCLQDVIIEAGIHSDWLRSTMARLI